MTSHNFNLGSLRQWQQVATGEVLDFPVPEQATRNVSFEVMADSYVSVHAVLDDCVYLVASGEGLMSVKFTTDEPVGILFKGEPSADIFVKTWVGTQVIPESRDPSYTTIEPRPAGPNEEMRRMMHIVRLNQERRERELMERLEAMERRANASAPPEPADDVEPVKEWGPDEKPPAADDAAD